MNAVWWTAQELAMQTLPGLPSTKRKINEMAAQQGWAGRVNTAGVRLARPRKGRGGGLEYHYTVLPVPAVAALSARGLVMNQGAQAVVVPASEAWKAFDALPDDKKAKARFRLDVLREIEALRTAGASATGAVAQVVALHKARARAGDGDHHAFSAATVANWKKAVKGLPKGDWLPALAPRHQGRTATAECDPNAWEFLKGDYLRLASATRISGRAMMMSPMAGALTRGRRRVVETGVISMTVTLSWSSSAGSSS
ncbi:DNA-binding domain-containing protein [Brevundimonas vesicularis]|uniref:DNA-binding domain-containing protein n=1 Tax=Brevundimonas vesicularis TaxID=41276 RepID=UPI0022AC4447|nr:DNA-binding domain-containing protein [Brevundimonas vesicularis]